MKNRDSFSNSPLHKAALAGDVDAIQDAVDAGHDINERDAEGRTATVHAAINDHADVVMSLIERKADLNIGDDEGYTASHYAAQNYSPEIVGLLIRHGATVDVEDLHGNTPLARATFESRGRGEVIEMLVKAGADPNRKNKYGQSAVGLARMIGNFDVSRFFSIVT